MIFVQKTQFTRIERARAATNQFMRIRKMLALIPLQTSDTYELVIGPMVHTEDVIRRIESNTGHQSHLSKLERNLV